MQIGATIARRQEARRVQQVAERKKREEAERVQLKAEREEVQLGATETRRQEVRRVQRVAERKKREEAERTQLKAERDRKFIEHWMSLSGTELEVEIATLCRALGYRAETTPLSGDGGADIILRKKNGERVVVQCKSHKKPVGPAVARELFGTMIHFRAASAVLVSPVGFTRGTEEFVRGKQIHLISAPQLTSLAQQVARRRTESPANATMFNFDTFAEAMENRGTP